MEKTTQKYSRPSKETNTTEKKIKAKKIVKIDPEPIIREKRDVDRKRSLWMDEYRDFFTQRMYPVSEAFLDRLSSDLIDWSKKNPDALRVEQFFLAKGIPITSVYRWVDRYHGFKEAFDSVDLMIGLRREHGAIKEGWNATIISKTMGMFDPRYKAFLEWESKLKTDNQPREAIKIELSDLSRKVTDQE